MFNSSAYELYADPATDELEPEDEDDKYIRRRQSPNTTEGRISIAERFKRTFSHKDLKVHFVGVW